jgi:phage terminase large subunit GpA-like protein
MTEAATVYLDRYRDGWRLDRELTVSEWADEHRYLSGVASAEPGLWRTSRTPYLRAVMDALSHTSSLKRVVFMKGAQVGGTEAGNNWVGYIIHHSPGPTLMVEPTVEVAKRVSKQRIQPMIDATPVLKSRVAESRARDSGNTVQSKEFDGGILMLTGANSGAGLRSMPVRNLFMDEVDEYPGDVDGQGDPVSLAEKRTSTFVRRKIFLVSTPTLKGFSRIAAEYEASDQQRYFLPCPECGKFDWLTWRDPDHHRIEWDERRPETARMVCSGCGARVSESRKTELLHRGEWRPTSVGENPDTVGFHLSALYSPLGWKSWSECVAEFLEAKEDPFRLKTWVNTVLGETWEEGGTKVEPGTLRARCEDYSDGTNVPQEVGALVAAVDVQLDRLEVMVNGYGSLEESWLVAFAQLHGDPTKETVWDDLDRYLAQPFTRVDGVRMNVECVLVDSGGAHTEQVYRYCGARIGRRVFAMKGSSYKGKPLVGRPSTNNRYRLPLFVICVDTGKDAVFARLQSTTPGPGYMHFPTWVDDEFLEQLTAEKSVRKYVKGRGAVREWVKVRERNEAFDLQVYALAALHVLFPDTQTLRTLSERALVAPAAAAAPVRNPARKSWVKNW